MNTKNIYRFLFFFGILLSLNSCTEDLDVIPGDDDEFLAEDFYASPEAYKQALAGLYGNLSLTGDGPGDSNLQGIDAGTSQYMRTWWYLQDLAADEPIWSYENDEGGAVKAIQRNTWSSANTILLGFFSRAMFSVAITNEFLRQTTDENLESRGHTSAVGGDIAAYRAEARLLRAMAYYHLMDLFGKAAFVTENDPIGTYQGPQYERAQLFEFVESELIAIEADLKEPKTNEYGRVDKAVAWMILAKMYLNAEVYIQQDKYTECITYTNKIINSGAYSVDHDYGLNFLADNDTNEAGMNEIIFATESDGEFTENYGPTTVIINGEVGSLEGNAADLGAQGWGGALRVRKQFAERFLNGDVPLTDTRNTLLTEGREIDIVDIGDRDSGFIITKFKNVTSSGEPGFNSTFVDTDFPMFRFADVYLMYAEAVVRGGAGGSLGEAVEYVNKLRDRANSTPILSGNLTLDFLIDERSRELYWEGHRRQDLIRFGLFTGGNYNWAWKGGSQSGIALPGHFNVYPLPSNNMAANPNLTQNPGY